MISKIEIKPEYKGILRLIELNNLGHVNVICGKNSSGKSSILEAIANSKVNKNILLKVGNETDINELIEMSLSERQHISKNYIDNLRIFFPNIIIVDIHYILIIQMKKD